MLFSELFAAISRLPAEKIKISLKKSDEEGIV
jgi:hypothetical protein